MLAAFLLASLALGASSAETWEDQIVLVSRRVADAARQAKAETLARLAAEANDHAAGLVAEYKKDPLARKLNLGRVPGIGRAFDRIAVPRHSEMGFGLQAGPHLALDGSIGFGIGIGFGSDDKEGLLTAAARHAARYAKEPHPRSTLPRFVLSQLRKSRELLKPQIDALAAYAPKSDAEARWKAKAAPSWAELLLKIDRAAAAAEPLAR